MGSEGAGGMFVGIWGGGGLTLFWGGGAEIATKLHDRNNYFQVFIFHVIIVGQR